MNTINARIAKELNVQTAQVTAAVDLLGEGATVPFIARYRKEKTGGLDDTQLRKLEERLGYLTELEDRRATVLKSITEQGKLTPELQRAINGADSKVELEDIYAPFKPKRRTKAQIAREAGLEPLADSAASPTRRSIPQARLPKFIDAEKGIADTKAALDGARSILIERIGENAKLVGDMREWLWATGVITSKVRQGQADRRREILRLLRLPPGDPRHALASRTRPAARPQRRHSRYRLDVDVEPGQTHPAELKIMTASNIADRGRPADKWLT